MSFKDAPSGETSTWPLLPLREVVVFPHAPMSLIVGRPRSLAAVERANRRTDREIFLVAQRAGDDVAPESDDLYTFGTIATLEQVLNLPDGNTRILVEGRRRARIKRFVGTDDLFEVELEEYQDHGTDDVEVQALVRTVKTTFERYVKLNRAVPPEMLLTVNALEDADRLADTLVAPLQFKLEERQELLETTDVGKRLERIYKALLTEIEFLQVEKKLKSRVKRERETNQRDYWLNEQMKAIQKELGDKEGRSDLEELAQALAEKALPQPVQERAEKELRKLSQMNMMSAEATVGAQLPGLDHPAAVDGVRRGGVRPWPMPLPSSTPITSASPRSRSASSSTWPWPRSSTRCAAPSCAWWVPPASARPLWPAPSPTPPGGRSSRSAWVACVTRPRSAVTGAPTSAQCPESWFTR